MEKEGGREKGVRSGFEWRGKVVGRLILGISSQNGGDLR